MQTQRIAHPELLRILDEEAASQADDSTRPEALDLTLQLRLAVTTGRPLDMLEADRLRHVLAEEVALRSTAIREAVEFGRQVRPNDLLRLTVAAAALEWT